ncbi:hypothetical protein ABID46_002314 [Moheibacter stercoris]|uniref:Uncharacterized protein n=1 Tax=Moheibacter stercoris TaxID=1628251 RepID=A0ABV2LYW9_9FLAO
MILSFDTITNLKLILEFQRKVWKILRVTVLSYTQAGILTTESPTKNLTLNLPLSCPTKHETPAYV